MHCTLHQLQIFLKIVETKSITKAAEELNLTQPAVSIQLKKLQDQFDIPLTEVIGRQLYITHFGADIALTAQKVLDEVATITYKSMTFRGKLSGKLTLSVVSTGKYVVPYFLTDFLKLNKGIDLEMDVTNKSKVVKSLENNEVDFALVSILPNDLKIHSEILLENKLYLVGNQNATTEIENKNTDLFSEYPLIFREEGSATRLVMENYLHRNSLQSVKKIQLTSNEAVKQAVIAGIGCSIMPIIGLKNELESGELKIIPMKGFPIISNWYLVWLKNKSLSPVADSYLKYVRNEKNNLKNIFFSWIDNY
ncbi:LysR family transcriptional regulator [Flavobacterium sp.]|uniref:LysR family transcriptional regulator n=1 Tax=Flavobacterium sp. TaxID=239 RepID=UPI0025EF3274|nr:LysR family transcriptional regulator [Flavobacterium sp.]